MLGGERSLDLALTGRRASECELAILMLLDRGGEPAASAAPSQTLPGWRGREGWGNESAENHGPTAATTDLPCGPALLALARDVLINDLLPLLPRDRQLDARLVANSMAIAEREAAAPACVESIAAEMRALFGADPGDSAVLLRRLARELRIGGLDNSPERAAQARAMLWRLTISRLRLANPRFLAANGFS
jgi:hypothetical protein